MKQAVRVNSPAVAISLTALFLALGGTVYAAGKAKLNGRAIVVKSLPGNRLKPHSVPANRLKPGALSATALSGQLTGAQIDAWTLDRVPSAAHAESADAADNAAHAESADNALHANEADTALDAVNAINAETVNGHRAGCDEGFASFAGACWQASANAADTAPKAAADCAGRGGTLPGALELAAFAKHSGVTLDAGGEWAGDIPVISGSDLYAVITVSATGVVDRATFSEERKYRCVLPLLH